MGSNEGETKQSIAVTDVLMCPRRLCYKTLNYEKLPVHAWSFRGRLGHEIIEEYIKQPRGFDELFELCWGREEKPEHILRGKQKFREDAEQIFANFLSWVEDRRPAFVEHSLSSNKGFHGRIDLIADQVLIDFKTGKQTNVKQLKLQLAAYYLLCKENGLTVEQAEIVFLGGDGYVVSEVKDLAEKGDEFLEMAKEALAVRDECLKQGKMAEVRAGIECVYCPYTHHCRGI